MRQRRSFLLFQCSSASRKFLNAAHSGVGRVGSNSVSVLFSEPKIPQCFRQRVARDCLEGFSALQRAENSSMQHPLVHRLQRLQVSVLFSEPKIPQSRRAQWSWASRKCFSALQRAENSSMPSRRSISTQTTRFQCSSASRKFLNSTALSIIALSSIVSVLFSEPKIPQ